MQDLFAWINPIHARVGRVPHRPRKPIRPGTGLSLEASEGRLVPAGLVASYAVTQDWGSGFQGQIRLDNQGTTDVTNWKLEFDYAPAISSIWDAQIQSHVGNHYIVTNAAWNSTLAGGSSVVFGFVASPGLTASSPTNHVLNGSPLTGTLPPVHDTYNYDRR